MHYFKRNIGDYHKKAGRLSMLEHGAYTLLMDACYDREKFPTLDQALDWCWARSDGEIAAVKFVLEKFFTLDGEQYMQHRIADEIERYHQNAKTNKQIALDREAARRSERERIEHEACTNLHLTNNQEPPTNNQEPQEDQKTCPQQAENGHKFRFADIQEAYNRICSPKLPACRAASDKRKKQAARLMDLEFNGIKPFRVHGQEFLELFFNDCLTNKHWIGENNTGWRADFDFVTKTDNAIKLLERMCD